MFNPTALVIESFVEQLQTMYQRVYGLLEPGYPGIIGFIAGWRSRTSPTATRPTTT
jgi:hypothetical protein